MFLRLDYINHKKGNLLWRESMNVLDEIDTEKLDKSNARVKFKELLEDIKAFPISLNVDRAKRIGCCEGTVRHKLKQLSLLLPVDEPKPFLKPTTDKQLIEMLTDDQIAYLTRNYRVDCLLGSACYKKSIQKEKYVAVATFYVKEEDLTALRHIKEKLVWDIVKDLRDKIGEKLDKFYVTIPTLEK